MDGPLSDVGSHTPRAEGVELDCLVNSFEAISTMRIIRVTERLQVPLGLQIAAAVLVLEALALSPVAPRSPFLLVLGLGFDALIVVFLLRGSRTAWIFALAAALLGVASPFVGGAIWSIGSGLAVASCLLLPGSRRYVWNSERTDVSGTGHFITFLDGVSNAVMRRLLAPGDIFTWKLVGQLLALVVALFLLVGAASLWKDGSGSGSVVVAALYRAVWIAYSLCQVGLVVVLIVVLCLHVSRRRSQDLDRGAR